MKVPQREHIIENGVIILTFCVRGPASLLPFRRVRADGSKSGG